MSDLEHVSATSSSGTNKPTHLVEGGEPVELRPGKDEDTTCPWVTKAWAQRWPTEEVRKARKVE